MLILPDHYRDSDYTCVDFSVDGLVSLVIQDADLGVGEAVVWLTRAQARELAHYILLQLPTEQTYEH